MNVIKNLMKDVFFKLKERTFKKRIKYIYENNGSKELVISFAAFSDRPCYNYYRALKNKRVDKLFLQDNFGLGSYLLYEGGVNLPRVLTMELLNSVISRKKYDKISTIGTSKGGTCAIYYGLEIEATDIYAGANQYFIGKYLNTESRAQIFKEMMGDNSKHSQKVLDEVMPTILNKHKDSRSKLHLLYSKLEHTYFDDIQFMISDLQKTNIRYVEIVEMFEDHNDVGKYFIPYIQKHI